MLQPDKTRPNGGNDEGTTMENKSLPRAVRAQPRILSATASTRKTQSSAALVQKAIAGAAKAEASSRRPLREKNLLSLTNLRGRTKSWGSAKASRSLNMDEDGKRVQVESEDDKHRYLTRSRAKKISKSMSDLIAV